MHRIEIEPAINPIGHCDRQILVMKMWNSGKAISVSRKTKQDDQKQQLISKFLWRLTILWPLAFVLFLLGAISFSQFFLYFCLEIAFRTGSKKVD